MTGEAPTDPPPTGPQRAGRRALAERPFVDRPVLDVDAAASAAARGAARWELPAPTLLRRGMNAIFESAEIVLRVGMPTADPLAAAALARALLASGIPVPEPIDRFFLVDERSGLTVSGWRRVSAVDRPVEWRAVGAIVRRVHALAPEAVPDGYPLADPRRFPWWDFAALLADVGADLDPGARRGIEAVIERHAAWHDLVGAGPVVCHGDVHPGNVMMSADGPVLLDWDLLCWAHPAWDHAMLAGYETRWGGPRSAYADFVDGYGRSFDRDPVLAAVRDLRDVAAVLMRVRAGRSDPNAREEAERRLQLFRGVTKAPTWCLQ